MVRCSNTLASNNKTKMTTPSDLQLQLALAKMLPEKIRVREYKCKCDWCIENYPDGSTDFYWEESRIKDTEWLHICWLVEQTLNDTIHEKFRAHLSILTSNPFPSSKDKYRHYTTASWQQRAQALCKVKEIEIC